MINTQTVKVNLIRQDYTTAFTLNQGDKGVPVKIELIDDGAPYTLLKDDIVTIEWLKPNSSPFLQEGGIKYGTNSIEITTPESIAQYSGSGSFNIIISNGDVRKGTIRREYKVVPTSMRPGTTSEDTITDAITELRSLSSEIASTVQNNQELIDNNQAATKSDIASINSDLEEKANKSEIGSPLTASTVVEMTDTSKVYVYTGNEEGYTTGNWYSYNGTSWVSGGVYNATAIGKDAVKTNNISDYNITFKKLKCLQGHIVPTTSNKVVFNIDTSTWTINTVLSCLCIHSNNHYSVAKGLSYSWATENNPSYARHIYIKSDGTFFISPSLDGYGLPDENQIIYIGTYYNGIVYGVNRFFFSVNGKQQTIDSNTIKDESIIMDKLKFVADKACLISGSIDIDTKTYTITCGNSTLAAYSGGYKNISNKVITYSTGGEDATYLKYIYLDIVNSNLIVRGSILESGKYALLGMLWSNKVYGITSPYLWKVNGINNGGFGDTKTDWNSNKFVIPENLYMIKNVEYGINAQNFNYNKFIDNEDLIYEIPLATRTEQFKGYGKISMPITGDYKTMVIGRSKDVRSVALSKDFTMHIRDVSDISKKDIKVLYIGDSIVEGNLPATLKHWLSNFGINATMIGTLNNKHEYGYGIKPPFDAEKGEGRGGWRLTDFTHTTEYSDGVCMQTSPFWDKDSNKINFTKYMNDNGFTDVDFVIIALGTNDITNFHHNETALDVDIDTQVNTIIERDFGTLINSIHEFNSNIKIAINPPMTAGTNIQFNQYALRWAEKQQSLFDEKENYPNVYCLPSYLSIGQLSGNQWSTIIRTDVSDINNTKKSSFSLDVHQHGMSQLINTIWVASWIINML